MTTAILRIHKIRQDRSPQGSSLGAGKNRTTTSKKDDRVKKMINFNRSVDLSLSSFHRKSPSLSCILFLPLPFSNKDLSLSLSLSVCLCLSLSPYLSPSPSPMDRKYYQLVSQQISLSPPLSPSPSPFRDDLPDFATGQRRNRMASPRGLVTATDSVDIVRARQSQSRNDVFYLIVQWGGVRCLDLTLVKSNGSGRQELCV